MPQTEKYGLIILAGGKSKRMGFNKAFAEINGKSLIAIIIERLSPLADEIIISGEKNVFRHLPYKIIPDDIPGCGAIGGTQACLNAAKNNTNIIIACDMPFVSRDLMLALLNRNFEDCIVAKENEQIHPLVGIYRKSCLPVIHQCIDKKEFTMQVLLKKLKTSYFDISTHPAFANKDLLININTFAVLKAIRNEN